MKAISFIIMALSAICGLSAAQRVTVIDSRDNSSVIGATVFSHSGTIKGITDNNGNIDGLSPADFPLTVKCLGYSQATCDSGSDTLKLVEASYPLSEITVTPGDRPIMKVICYIRELTSGTTESDTIQFFAEHMAAFYIPTIEKTKIKVTTNPQKLKSQFYKPLISGSNSEGISRDADYDDFSWLMLVSYPAENFNVPQSILNGAAADTVKGKYYPKTITRANSGTITQTIDMLSDRKNHTYSPSFFKLFGLTIDITELRSAWAYRNEMKPMYEPSDVIYETFSMDILGKGKLIKKAFKSSEPVNMHAYYELYPTSIEYLTIEEADDQLHHNPPVTEIIRSPIAPPLDPALQARVAKSARNNQP